MIAIDADVLTDFFAGNPSVLSCAAQYSAQELAIPVVVIEEILRGRLLAIRQAEAAKPHRDIVRAYEMLESSLLDTSQMTILPYTTSADSQFLEWRSQKLRVGTHDLRIASICFVSSITLVTRNRRDFERVPGLSLETWM